MDNSRTHTPDEVPPQKPDLLQGTLETVYSLYPASGLVALHLRGADGSEREVLADAASLLGQLAAAFGSPQDALGQQIELALDLFGFPEVQALQPAAPAGAFRCTSAPAVEIA